MSTHQFTLTRGKPYQLTFGATQPYMRLRPYVRRADGRGFWNRYVQAGTTTTFKVQLEQPAASEVSVPLTFSGDAVHGTHYQVLSPNPVVIPAGNTEADVIVAALDAGIWHHERLAIITAGEPTNAHLRTDKDWDQTVAFAGGATEGRRHAWWLRIRPVHTAPLLDFVLSSSSMTYSAPTITVTARITELSSEDTLCYLLRTTSSTADPGDYTLTDDVSGAVDLITIPAGSLQGTATLEWTGSAPGAPVTVVIRHRTLANTGQKNYCTFTETLAQHENEVVVGFEPYAGEPTNYTFSGTNQAGLTQDDNMQVLGSGYAMPDGYGEASLVVVGDGALGPPKHRKSGNAGSVPDADFGYTADGVAQSPQFAGDWMVYSWYVKKPATAARQSPYFGIELNERSATANRTHLAILRWSGLVPVYDSQIGLGVADGIDDFQVNIIDDDAYCHNSTTSKVEDNWYRVALSIKPNPTLYGGNSNQFLFPYHYPAAGADATETNKGKGVVVAWPQLEFRTTAQGPLPTAYQPIRRMWYDAFNGAWLNAAGNFQHTLTITP